MVTPVQNSSFPTRTIPSSNKAPIFIIMFSLVIAMFGTAFLFFTSGDTATGVGRVGWLILICGIIWVGTVWLSRASFLLLIGGIILMGLGLVCIFLEPSLHHNQAENHKKEGNYNSAIKEYRKANQTANLTTNIPENYLLLGDSLLKAKRYEAALTAYKTVSENSYSPNKFNDTANRQIRVTYLAWGQSLLSKGDYADALDLLEPNLKLNPVGTELEAYHSAIIDGYNGIGKNLLNEKNYDGLITKITPVFNIYANSDRQKHLQGLLAGAYLEKADQFAGQKDFAKAIENYETTLKYTVVPEVSYEVSRRVSNQYLAQGEDFINKGQFRQAVEILETGQKKHATPATPGQFRASLAKAHLKWAEADEKAANFESALAQYRLILTKFGEFPNFTTPASEAQPRVLFNWANQQTQAKNYNAAISTYQEVIEKFGASSFAQQARKTLNAPQPVQVTVIKEGVPLAKTRIQLYEKWRFGTNDLFYPSGRILDFTTDDKGNFTATLEPDKEWLLGFWNGSDFETHTNLARTVPRNTISSTPLHFTVITERIEKALSPFRI
jgi:tetratricopeptide (TPR) repeat protein